MDQLPLIPTASSGPTFDERGVVRWHDIDLMATTAIRAYQRDDHVVAGMCILMPGVLDRVLELTEEGGYA